MSKFLVAIGTRPDVIKQAPVIRALREAGQDVFVWSSNQGPDLFPEDLRDLVSHTETIDWSKGLSYGVHETIKEFGATLREYDQFLDDPPDVVVVHGDDATAYATAVSAFLEGIPVAHVEAGLRTYAREPWPEEAFRRMIAAVARFHFAPDEDAKENLYNEGCTYRSDPSDVYVVGNTVIDTLPHQQLKILVTLHRRENSGERIQRALNVLSDGIDHYGVDVHIIRHPNWEAQDYDIGQISYDPHSRETLLEILADSDLVVTDSGGLQEEAAHFGVPCLVYRTATERTGLLDAGAVELVDPDSETALKDALERHLHRRRVYGDGDTGKQIAEILVREVESES